MRPQNVFLSMFCSLSKNLISSTVVGLGRKFDLTSFQPGLPSSWPLLFYTKGVLVDIYFMQANVMIKSYRCARECVICTYICPYMIGSALANAGWWRAPGFLKLILCGLSVCVCVYVCVCVCVSVRPSVPKAINN